MSDRKKILIIDDDPDIIEAVTTVLTAHGFEASAATNGKEGIESVAKVKPDLVLCDMMMETVDAGSKVAQEIKKKNKHLPVYLLSSIGAATMQNVEIEKLGFSGVFQKPITPDHLVKTIKKELHIK
ncbi:MAG: response regulator [Spirochaetes bacterium]|nr:response regulator [Spirochaetota bacterium]